MNGDWYDNIGKAGILLLLHNDEVLHTNYSGYTLTHKNRCNLTLKSFWNNTSRFKKELRRWRNYGHMSKGMSL